MKKYAISGSWRHTNEQLRQDVRIAVTRIMEEGHMIITGGALGVDFIATDQALKCNPKADRIKVIIPTSLVVYTRHFFNRASEGAIKKSQAQELSDQLTDLKNRNPSALVEMSHNVCTPETYYDRNSRVVDLSTHLMAFHVNESQGVQDAINKAKEQGKPVKVWRYKI